MAKIERIAADLGHFGEVLLDDYRGSMERRLSSSPEDKQFARPLLASTDIIAEQMEQEECGTPTILAPMISGAERQCRSRWEKLVEHLFNKRGITRWGRLLGLPLEISNIYHVLESETGFVFDDKIKKLYYYGFFKKASGFAVINAFQVEVLIDELVGVGDIDLQGMMDDLNVNNGMFDFRAFAQLLCKVLQFRELCKQASSNDSCWLRWYRWMVPLNPDTIFKQSWDLMVLSLLLYSSFLVPYNMAFEDGTVDSHMSFKYIFDVLLDVMFMLDVALSFVTSYVDAKGMLVVDLREISSRYLRTWFLPDLGGSFPFENVIDLFVDSTENIGVMRILKLVRLVKLIRAVRVFAALGELGNKEGFSWLKNVIGVVRSVFVILYVAHAVGCFFYMAFVPNSSYNWMYAYRADLQNADNTQHYVTALYWAMITITTMGYGDIIPVTHDERIFCIFVAMIGAVVFSFCMGTITSLVSNTTGAAYAVAQKLQHATEYHHFREFSTKTRRLIAGFYKITWNKTAKLYREDEILDELSSQLRKAALEEIGVKSKPIIPMLQGFDDEAVGYVFTRLRRVDFLDGDVIFQRGDRASEMYFVGSGTVSIHLDRKFRPSKTFRGSFTNKKGRHLPDGEELTDGTGGRGARMVEQGGVVGELALFPDISAPHRTEAAVAKTCVTAYALSSAEMPRLAELYPHVVSGLREYCQLKDAENRAKGNASWEGEVVGWRSAGASGTCKLRSAITQMQRNLLSIKEQNVLLAATGAPNGRVLKLFTVPSSSSGVGGETEPTNLSCVLSDKGELLCVEHNTEGVTGSAAGSLGFVRPGQSTYRVMESDEVRKRVGRLALAVGGASQLFGCCISCFLDVSATSPGLAGDLFLFSWLDEEIEALAYELDRFSIQCLPSLGPGAIPSPMTPFSESHSPLSNAPLFPEFPQKLESKSSFLENHFCGAGIEVFRESPSDEQQDDFVLHRTPQAQTLPNTFWSGRNLMREAEAFFLPLSQDEKSTARTVISSDGIWMHAEKLALLAEGLNRDPDQLQNILLKIFALHVELVKSLLDRTAASLVSESASTPREECVDFGLSGESREASLAQPAPPVPQGGQQQSTSSTTVGAVNFGSAHCESHEVDLSEFTLTPEPEHDSYGLETGLDASLASLSPDMKRIKAWESIVQKLMESGGWKGLKVSLFGLPDDVIKTFSELESSIKKIDADDQKTYFRAFFKKASGFAVINSLQAEELIDELVGIGDVDLQQMIDDIHVNNGLVDFRAFAQLLCQVLRIKELEEITNSQDVCWRRWYRWMIPFHPDNLFKQGWDFSVLLLLLYSSFQVPFSMAFQDRVIYETTSPVYILDVLLDVMFMVDVAISFLTAYFDRKGLLIVGLKPIAKKYLSSWFLLDFCGSFPFDKFLYLFLTEAGNVGAMRILKLVRLVKILRALRVLKALNQLGEKEGFGALKTAIGIFRTLFVLIFVAHLLGCFFAMLILTEPERNWMYMYDPSLEFADEWQQYQTSLYWAIISITTVGYGDIKPAIPSERLFCIFVAMIGAVVFSFCMGTISNLISNASASQQSYMKKEQEVIEYLSFREFSSHLKVKIRTYFSISWKKNGSLFREDEILDELSSQLRKAALEEIGVKSKPIIPMLQGFDDEAVGYVFTRLRRVDFLDGDVIFQRGDRASEMYFVGSGTVSIHLDRKFRPSKTFRGSFTNKKGRHLPEGEELTDGTGGRGARMVEQGGVVGELALFPDISAPHRTEAAVAKTCVTAYALSSTEMPRLAELYPHVVSGLREYCQLKDAENRAKGNASWEGEVVGWRSAGASGTCKLRSAITQMQRNLLSIKEQNVLLAATGAPNGRVLKLFTVPSTSSGVGGETEPTNLSCVLSDKGELLCVEHNTEGVTGSAAGSLGFVRQGQSTYRVMESDEVRTHVVRAGESQIFGCCIHVFDSACSDVCAVADTGREVFVFSWVEEELDGLVEVLDEALGSTASKQIEITHLD